MTLDEACTAAGLPSPIHQFFHMLGIAHELETRFVKDHPTRAAEIKAAFGGLCPQSGMLRLSDAVYRSHATDILTAVACGNTKPRATDAECMAALSEQSLKAPLARDFAAAYWLAFSRVMGKDVVAKLGPDMASGFTEFDLRDGRERLEELRNDITRRIGKSRDPNA